jgi:rare lipoprotein A
MPSQALYTNKNNQKGHRIKGVVLVKNIFFISVISFLGLSSALLNEVSAKTNLQEQDSLQQLPKKELIKDISLKLEQNESVSSKKEKLHPTANLSYSVGGVRYQPEKNAKSFTQTGGASWYGKPFHGRKTASGERYDMYQLTAAHRTLPIPSYVKVTNLKNGKEVVVKINDRGPFHGKRVLDLSYAAAQKLDFVGSGVANVKIERIFPGQETTPAPEATPMPAPESMEPIFVHLKKFDNMADAQSYLNRLNQKAESQLSARLHMIKQTDHYVVRLGPFDKNADAQYARKAILLAL